MVLQPHDVESGLERRLAELERELSKLRRRVETLEAPRPGPEVPATGSEAAHDAAEPEAMESEPFLAWTSGSSIFARAAAICFLLVIALLLRTVTDAQLIPRPVGSVIGLAYGLLLVGVGWRSYARGSKLAAVFAVCGALLTYSIVWETHAHFESLSAPAAYVLLVLTGTVMVWLGRRHGAIVPAAIGSLGALFVAVAIDFPHPAFPALLSVLLLVSLLALAALAIPRTGWIAWVVVVVSLGMLEVWTGAVVKAATASPLAGVLPGTFVPTVDVFMAAWLVAPFFYLRRRAASPPSVLLALPTVAVAWGFFALHRVLSARGASEVSLAIAYVGVGVACLALSALLSRRAEEATDVAAFGIAGAIALGLGISVALPSWTAALPVLAAVALGLFGLSLRWRSSVIRTASYILQLLVAGLLVWVVLAKADEVGTTAGVLAGSLVAVAGALHWLWARRAGLHADAALAEVDPEDHAAIALLLGALVSAFFSARLALHGLLGLPSGETSATFGCGQSVIISIAAAALIILAFARRSRELRNVAILVTGVGALKVFLGDLLRTSGVPLVVSVFTFGLVTALVSIILRRWQRNAARHAQAHAS